MSSCQGNSTDDTSVKLEVDYKSGYGGLNIEFIENYPPKEVFANSDFTVAMKLSNQGAYDLFDGKLKLLGFVDNFVELYDSDSISFPKTGNKLNGVSELTPVGGVEHFEFSGQTKELKKGAQKQTIIFFANAEFDYSNELVTTVCVNPSSYEVYDGGCKAQDTLDFHGQGSPLAISRIEQITNTGGDKEIRFVITIKNEGEGNPEQIILTDYELGGEDLDCSFRDNSNSNSKIFIYDDEDEIKLVCKSSITAQSSYETSLHLGYSFTYQNILKGSFDIIR